MLLSVREASNMAEWRWAGVVLLRVTVYNAMRGVLVYSGFMRVMVSAVRVLGSSPSACAINASLIAVMR